MLEKRASRGLQNEKSPGQSENKGNDFCNTLLEGYEWIRSLVIKNRETVAVHEMSHSERLGES